jgi:antitoxin component of MazEF toxin-antitoxin module
MPQIGKIEKQGETLILRLPSEYAEQLSLAEGDEVVISRLHDSLEIGSTKRRRLLAIEKGRELAARYRRVFTAR